jgi:hypothetical protein
MSSTAAPRDSTEMESLKREIIASVRAELRDALRDLAMHATPLATAASSPATAMPLAPHQQHQQQPVVPLIRPPVPPPPPCDLYQTHLYTQL